MPNENLAKRKEALLKSKYDVHLVFAGCTRGGIVDSYAGIMNSKLEKKFGRGFYKVNKIKNSNITPHFKLVSGFVESSH